MFNRSCGQSNDVMMCIIINQIYVTYLISPFQFIVESCVYMYEYKGWTMTQDFVSRVQLLDEQWLVVDSHTTLFSTCDTVQFSEYLFYLGDLMTLSMKDLIISQGIEGTNREILQLLMFYIFEA